MLSEGVFSLSALACSALTLRGEVFGWGWCRCGYWIECRLANFWGDSGELRFV